MSDQIKIVLAQINPTVGALVKNKDKILDIVRQARKEKASIVVFPELALCGYPPEDLILKPFFLDKTKEALQEIILESKNCNTAIILGTPHSDKNGNHYNSAYYIKNGTVHSIAHKKHLPNYMVFDEKRLFTRGELMPIEVHEAQIHLGFVICEDLWFPDVSALLGDQGAEILISIHASPYEIGKRERRLEQARSRAIENNIPIIYLNQVGGQDELVFDGASFCVDRKGNVVNQLKYWQEDISVITLEREDNHWQFADKKPLQQRDDLEDQYSALVIGTRDYIEKNGFKKVLLGLSGGVDSAFAAAVCMDALGPDRVDSYMLFSPYTSKESLDDAEECANLMQISYKALSINNGMVAAHEMIDEVLGGEHASEITAQNIQSRLRGLILMALSNDTSALLITTGNKSEMAVGYATLYGDMCGALNPLKDVYKTKVYDLCHWRNNNHSDFLLGPKGRVIPENIITKAPSAELKPNQKDEDSLPPYEVLDDILECLIEKEMSMDMIEAKGHDKQTINKVWRMLDYSEYKRRQSPPGIKITTRAFGKERRYPITNGFTSII